MFIQIKLNLVKPRILVAENSIEWLVDSTIKLYSKMFAIVCQKRADDSYCSNKMKKTAKIIFVDVKDDFKIHTFNCVIFPIFLYFILKKRLVNLSKLLDWTKIVSLEQHVCAMNIAQKFSE